MGVRYQKYRSIAIPLNIGIELSQVSRYFDIFGIEPALVDSLYMLCLHGECVDSLRMLCLHGECVDSLRMLCLHGECVDSLCTTNLVIMMVCSHDGIIS